VDSDCLAQLLLDHNQEVDRVMDVLLNQYGIAPLIPVKLSTPGSVQTSHATRLQDWERATSAEVYMYHRQKEMDIRSKIDYLSKRAVNAFRSGQVAVASQLKGEIGALREVLREHSDDAQEAIYQHNNPNSNQVGGERVSSSSATRDACSIDLHGLHVAEAVQKVEEELRNTDSLHKTRVMHIITGKGKHSGGSSAVNRAVRMRLAELGYRYEMGNSHGRINTGVLTVFLR